jgi:GTP:adenosylcobinamide-phosphate guanylyltransferase
VSAPGPTFDAVVLAGSRGGSDPVAAAAGASHKCLVTAGGVPMLARVVEALAASAWIGRILVVLDQPDLMGTLPRLAPLIESGRLGAMGAAPSPSLSVRAALGRLQTFPVLVTTADHALLSGAIIDAFCGAAIESGADVAAGLASATAILGAYPESRRTFWHFRGERYSGANLFAILTPRGENAVVFWRRVEQDRKRPWRIARAFGWGALLAYLSRRLTLEQATRRLSRVLDASAVAVPIAIAEAAIDVDKPEDLELVERILAARRAA